MWWSLHKKQEGRQVSGSFPVDVPLNPVSCSSKLTEPKRGSWDLWSVDIFRNTGDNWDVLLASEVVGEGSLVGWSPTCFQVDTVGIEQSSRTPSWCRRMAWCWKKHTRIGTRDQGRFCKTWRKSAGAFGERFSSQKRKRHVKRKSFPTLTAVFIFLARGAARSGPGFWGGSSHLVDRRWQAAGREPGCWGRRTAETKRTCVLADITEPWKLFWACPPFDFLLNIKINVLMI